MSRIVETDALTPNDLTVIRRVHNQCREDNLGRMARTGPCREFAIQYLNMEGKVDLDAVWAERDAQQDAANNARLSAFQERRSA